MNRSIFGMRGGQYRDVHVSAQEKCSAVPKGPLPIHGFESNVELEFREAARVECPVSVRANIQTNYRHSNVGRANEHAR